MFSRKKFVDLGSIGHEFVDVDPNKCIGCGICELVCSLEKSEKGAFNPLTSRIKVLRHPLVNVAITCRLCENPPCVRACPRGALMQSLKNGVIIVDEEKCIGCGWCVKACEFGSITIDPFKGIAIVCDLCEGREGTGVFPGRKIVRQACVEWCPEEALNLSTRGRLAQRAREVAVSKLFSTKEIESSAT